MRSRRTRTPRPAWGPLAALTAVALLLALAAPLAAQELRYVEVGGTSEVRGAPTEGKVADDAADAPALGELVRLQDVPLGQGFVGEVEPNGTFGQATPLGGNNVVGYGAVFQNGDVDFWSFSGLAGDRVYVATMTSASSNGSTDSVLDVLDVDGTTVLENDDENGSMGGSSSSIAGVTLPANGTYFVRVRHFSATSQLRPYHLHFQLHSGAPDLEVEPNDIVAQPLPASGWVAGDLSAAADVDRYSLALNAGDTVYIGLDLDPERDTVEWNGQTGLFPFNNFILVVNDAGTTGPDSEAFFMTVQASGTYEVFVMAPAGGTTFGTYQVNVSVLPSTDQGLNCTTYTSTDTPLVIPDGPGQVTSTIIVPPGNPIADVDVQLNLNHLAPLDLDLQLMSPAGNDNGLVTDIGAASQPVWNFTLDDEAGSTPLYTVLNGSTFAPENIYLLSWFDGENAGGAWSLVVRDDTAANGGTLNSWSLRICEEPPVPACAPGSNPVTVYSSDFEADDGGFTHSGVLDEWERGLPTFVPITTCASGTNCWKTDLDGQYENSSVQDLLSPPISLAGLTGPVVVSWAQRYHIESASFDHWNVTAREVGNPANATNLYEWLGATMNNSVGNPSTTINESAGWARFSRTVDSLAGLNAELLFHLDTDSSVQLTGPAIDDVSVTACLPGVAEITLDKTVGLTPGVCGVDETLTVDLGTPVTYCYTVTNTGNVTLTSHTLVDDQLGTIFQNLPFTLTPGAAAFLTIDDVVLDATTVNVATWTASDSSAQTVCSAGGITITGAQGTPYPSTVTVAGASAPTSIAVDLNGFSHTYTDDVDVLLVGPGGQNLVVMADAGGPNAVTGIDLGLADSAPIPLFDENPLVTGDYQPGDFLGQPDSWPPPAPVPPYGEPAPTGTDTFTSVFGGLDPNGTWNLYVTDAFPGADDGSFTGWCLSAVTGGAQAQATDTATVTVLIPDIDVAPTSLSSTLDPGQTDTQQLDIANLGDGDLDWTIAEAPPAPLSIPASDGHFQRGLYAPSAGAAPNASPRSMPAATDLERLLGANTAYSWNSQNGPYYTVFDITDPANLPNITPFDPTGQFIGAGEYVDGLVYMVDVANNMWEVDPPTGTILNTFVATAPPGGETYSGMALDPTSGVVYAGSTNVATSSLFTMDVTTGTATLIGPITNCPGLIGLAVDGNGDLWGYDIVGDVLLSIDKTTGAGTVIGSIGFDANFGQGMGWHPATDTLYMAAFNNGTFLAELRSVDRTTGNTTLVGVLGSTTPGGLNQLSWLGLELAGGPCSAPSDLPWVSVNPTSGTTPPNQSSTVDVTFDSTGLTPGVTYDGSLCVESNDPDEGLVEVPVSLTVNDTMPFFGDFEEGDTSDWTATVP